MAKRDFTQVAKSIIDKITGNAPPESIEEVSSKNPHAQALAALGASKGGKARAKSLTKKKRREIAKKAARTRWTNK
jgi:hypothetical protein